MHDAHPQPAAAAAAGPPASLAAVLAEVHVAIARASDDVDLLAALVGALERHAPARVELCRTICDDAGAPRQLALVARWSADGVRAEASPPAPITAPAGLAALWLADPTEVLRIADLTSDPRVGPDERAALAPHAAVTVLPLHSSRHGSWEGCVRLLWSAPHGTCAEELFVARLLMQTVAAALAGRRTLQEHADALVEARALHAGQTRLHAVDSFAELLAVIAELAHAHDAGAAWLGRIDADGDGLPAWFEILAVAGASEVPVGARFHVPALSQRPPGGTPEQFIVDLDAEAAIDPGVRALGLGFALRGVATLPLRWRGRSTGMVVLAWSEPHEFAARERRLYTALARQAAIVFDNRLLLGHTQAALREQQRQRATLAAVLDHLPVGVVVHAVGRDEPIHSNRQARQLARELGDRDLLHPGSDRVLAPEMWPVARTLASGRLCAAEADIHADDGTRRHLEALAAPVHDERGALTHVIGVTTDITAARQAEAERQRMLEALIRAQAEALAERSTPLLPITGEILVMPIVGTIDAGRGREITETLVGLGGHHRVRVAILDVTGAGVLDALAAEALVGAARALRLRGATPVLTGLSPGSAAVLSGLGVDLAGVIVCASLQAGITRARALVARRPVLRDSHR